jgi:tetratricopeptide (TPR) repeat protein
VPVLCAVVASLDVRITHDVDADRDALVRRMDELTARAVRLNDVLPVTWFFRSVALLYAGQWQASLEACAKSIALEPHSAGLVTHRAWLTVLCGRPEDALPIIEEAIALDPQRGQAQMQVLCDARLLMGRYEDAIEAGEKAIGLGAVDDMETSLALAAAYANVGNAEKAASACNSALRLEPRYTIAIHGARRSRHPRYVQLLEKHLYPGLRKAGLPEG